MQLSYEISSLPFVHWSELESLPNCAGIYFAIDAKNIIHYIGQAQDLQKRWKNHHRHFQLNQINEKYPIKLYCLAWNKSDLKTAEKHFIQKYKPLLNSTEVKTPQVIPSEIILRQLFKKIARKIYVVGIAENPTTYLKTVYVRFDATNCTARGAVAVIKKFQRENKGSSLKIKWKKYVPKMYGGVVYKVASREARRQALKNRTYNNHWEIACNGVILDLTPESGLQKLAIFKERAVPYKLANVKTRTVTQDDWNTFFKNSLSRLNHFAGIQAVDINRDPVPLFWKCPPHIH